MQTLSNQAQHSLHGHSIYCVQVCVTEAIASRRAALSGEAHSGPEVAWTLEVQMLPLREYLESAQVRPSLRCYVVQGQQPGRVDL